MKIRELRNTPPTTPDHLWDWIYSFTGVKVARRSVCSGHTSPFEAFCSWYFDPADITLMLGPRGGGKSFLSAMDTHLKSRFNPRYGTRILGGSKAQSEQIYRALKDIVIDGTGSLGTDAESVRKLLKTEAHYSNGSEVSILAASSTSVRGPHVPSLKLDEVDEIDPALRESAVGMAMAKRGRKSTIVMTSTWHKLHGPMTGLLDRAKAGEIPYHQFCLFEVLERCPEERSGKYLEKCPECPLVTWCHGEGLPKAKRSNGHYAIDSAIQKIRGTSLRVFEADYLCLGPKADGVWFPGFSTRHISAAAEYVASIPVHLSIDSGVFTGAVFFQVHRWASPEGPIEEIHVFADFLSEGTTAENVAISLKLLAAKVCESKLDKISTDPAGGARNPIGPSVIAEYERAGLKRLTRWPGGSVSDGLALVDSFLSPADGAVRLLIHPRCTALISALKSYRRARRQGQFLDYPEDPQHPAEDLVDALRGGIRTEFPDGRRQPPRTKPVHYGQVFY